MKLCKMRQQKNLPTQQIFYTIPSFNGPLAQLVEQLTLNQRVVGSIPTRPTSFQVIRLLCDWILYSIDASENLAVPNLNITLRKWRNW